MEETNEKQSLTVSYGETISEKGSYSSKKVLVSRTLTLNENENIDEVYSKVLGWIKEKIEQEKN